MNRLNISNWRFNCGLCDVSMNLQQVQSTKATNADRSRLEALEEEVRDMQLEVQVAAVH